MTTTVLLGGRIQSPSAPGATAMAVADGTVIWLGGDEPARARFDGADEVVELSGAFVAPAFVDSHVHATSAGLLLDGLDLTRATSLRACLDTVARHAAERPGAVLWGHGWDETTWPEARPPSRAELDRAAAGSAVYLSRIDVHSAAVSSALLRRAPGAVDAAWGGPDGMYALRLGSARAEAMNPYAMLDHAGVVLAFGSDTPVTGVDPWAAVRAAVHHRTPGSGISPSVAFAAHTRGGYRAAAGTDPRAGTLVPGVPATYAVWDTEPDLISPDAELPTCLRTVRNGRTIFDVEGALG